MVPLEQFGVAEVFYVPANGLGGDGEVLGESFDGDKSFVENHIIDRFLSSRQGSDDVSCIVSPFSDVHLYTPFSVFFRTNLRLFTCVIPS